MISSQLEVGLLQLESSYLQYTGYRVERLTPSTLNAVITTTILPTLLVGEKYD